MNQDFFQSRFFLSSIDELKKLQAELPKRQIDIPTTEELKNYQKW